MDVTLIEVQVHVADLPSTPLGESHPPIERDPPLFAASARSDPDVRGGAFDHVAKPDLLVADESGQAHLVRRAFARVWMVLVFDFLRHAVRLCAIDKV
jgi:hypothetical protein